MRMVSAQHARRDVKEKLYRIKPPPSPYLKPAPGGGTATEVGCCCCVRQFHPAAPMDCLRVVVVVVVVAEVTCFAHCRPRRKRSAGHHRPVRHIPPQPAAAATSLAPLREPPPHHQRRGPRRHRCRLPPLAAQLLRRPSRLHALDAAGRAASPRVRLRGRSALLYPLPPSRSREHQLHVRNALR